MFAYTRGRITRLLEIDFIRFCIVGGTGFVINLVILTVLTKSFGISTFISQLIGAEIALFCNFMLHHHWTYKRHKVQKTFRNLLIQFHATTWPAIVGSSLMVSGGERFLHLSNLWALAVSSVIALIWNFMWSKYVVWRDVSIKDAESIVQ